MIGWIRLAIWAVAGWIAEHGDHIELRIVPGEHVYEEVIEHACEVISERACEAQMIAEEVLHDLGVA